MNRGVPTSARLPRGVALRQRLIQRLARQRGSAAANFRWRLWARRLAARLHRRAFAARPAELVLRRRLPLLTIRRSTFVTSNSSRQINLVVSRLLHVSVRAAMSRRDPAVARRTSRPVVFRQAPALQSRSSPSRSLAEQKGDAGAAAVYGGRTLVLNLFERGSIATQRRTSVSTRTTSGAALLRPGIPRLHRQAGRAMPITRRVVNRAITIIRSVQKLPHWSAAAAFGAEPARPAVVRSRRVESPVSRPSTVVSARRPESSSAVAHHESGPESAVRMGPVRAERIATGVPRGPDHGLNVPAETLGLLTQHVMRELDRRVTSARERMGRI